MPSCRQGIGTALVGAIEALFQREGMATVVADTPESNVPARRFLEKLGFGNPISHVYMSLNIANSKGKDGVKAPRKKKGAPKQKPVRVRQMDIDDLGEGEREDVGKERRNYGKGTGKHGVCKK